MAVEASSVPLSKYCLRITKGTTPTTLGRAFVAEGINFVKSEAITPDGRIDPSNFAFIDGETNHVLSRSILQESDVLFSMAGVYLGKTALVPPSILPANTNQAVGIIRVDQTKADPRFIHYALSAPFIRELVHRSVAQSAQPNFNLRDIGDLPIPDLPLREQRAVTHILGTLDDKIELNRRMNETLEAMARAIFKSWFVDFDPVRAKAEGRQPFGMDAATAALFPGSFVDSPLGKVPAGWKVKKLSDLCATQYGYTASAVEEPIGSKFLRVMDINKQNWIDWGTVPHCVIDSESKSVYALKVGDLVVARMADPGKCAIIEDEVDAVFASYLVRLKANSLAESYFIYGFLKSDCYADYTAGAKSGSVQPNMNAKVIVGASLVTPSLALMDRYLQAVLPLRRHLVSNVRESRTLAALRDALLPKLVSGEIRIRNTENLIEASR